ncbi:MAG: hypothetical protein K2Y30_01820 [Flavobacteriaceae bacterium]|nr:hypothetical protein [Flavobacteriaceae bacterium]
MIVEFWKTNENPITCYSSKPFIQNEASSLIKIKPRIGKTQAYRSIPVTVETKQGEVNTYPTVFEASQALGMTYNGLCALLNGKAKNLTEYKIYKSTLNN